MQQAINFLSSASSTVISILLILLIALLTQALLKMFLQRSTTFLTRKELFHNTKERQKRVKTINSVIGAVAGLIVWSVAAIAILDKLGVPIGPIVAGTTILTAAIAFGTQSLIKDFVTGLFIIAENQYQIDDYVDIGTTAGISGKVEALSVRTTTVRGDDGSLYFVPNGSITITSNKSASPLNLSITVELAAESNLTDFAKQIALVSKNLNEAATTAGLINKGPSVGDILSVTKKSIRINLNYTTTASKRKIATSALWRTIADASEKDLIHLV